MKQLGDITLIDWARQPPVDCVTGGSPCQDLSIAGRRAGLAGERSGLYMEQIKCIKELRNADKSRGRTGKDIRPRFMVWENVPGAFSSNKGEDFSVVLNEAISVAEPQAPAVPVPKEGWHYAGTIVGDGWSIAWRTHDAQYWGVPQRRRRIALVCDFGGSTASEILFERESLRGAITPSGKARSGIAVDTEAGVRKADNKIIVLGTQQGGAEIAENLCPAITAAAGMSGNNQPVLLDLTRGKTYCIQGNSIDRIDTAGCEGKGWREDVSYTLNTVDKHAVLAYSKQRSDVFKENRVASTQSARQHKDATDLIVSTVVQGIDGYNAALCGDVTSTLGTNCGMSTGRNGVLVLNDQGGAGWM